MNPSGSNARGIGRTLLYVVAVLAVLLPLICSLVPPRVVYDEADTRWQTTFQRIEWLAVQCDQFNRITGKWPVEMRELKAGMVITNAALFLDGWGREIRLTLLTNPPPRVFLTSYGADGQPGGVGIDGDISLAVDDLREPAGRPDPPKRK